MYYATIKVPCFDAELAVSYYYDRDEEMITFDDCYIEGKDGPVAIETDDIYVPEKRNGKISMVCLSTLVQQGLDEQNLEYE